MSDEDEQIEFEDRWPSADSGVKITEDAEIVSFDNEQDDDNWVDPSTLQYDQPVPHPKACDCSWCKDES